MERARDWFMAPMPSSSTGLRGHWPSPRSVFVLERTSWSTWNRAKGELTSISYVNSQESGTSAGLEVLFNLTGTINFSALLQRYVPSSYKVRLYKTAFWKQRIAQVLAVLSGGRIFGTRLRQGRGIAALSCLYIWFFMSQFVQVRTSHSYKLRPLSLEPCWVGFESWSLGILSWKDK